MISSSIFLGKKAWARVACFLIVTLLANLGNAEHFSFDLASAVAYALRRVPAFASVKTKKEISEISLESAHFLFFPRLSLFALSGINTTIPEWPTLWNNSLTLTLQQPVLSHSVNGISYEIAQTKDTIAKIDIELERDRLCMNVVKDFYAYSAAVEQREIKKQKLDVLMKQLNIVNRRFRQGFKTQRDVLRFEAQVQQAQIQQAAANNRVEQAKETLITSITGGNRQQISDSFEFVALTPPPIALDAIPTKEPIIEHHPLFKKLELEQQIAASEVNLSRRKLWPELSASASAIGNANLGFMKASLFEPTAAFMVGLSLQLDLFDFGHRRRDIAIAIKNRDIKAFALQTQLSSETAIITQMMVTISLLKESLLLNKRLLALEQDNFKRIEHDYLQGKAQYLDVISALNNLSDVKSALSSAMFDLEIQMTTHRYYEGTLYDWIF